MRFTIRDLLWLTVVVAFGAAWFADSSSKTAEIVEVRRKWWTLRNSTDEAAKKIGSEVRDLGHGKIQLVPPPGMPTAPAKAN